MRTFSIRDDLEQIILQYVRAIPEVFMDFDLASVEIVAQDDEYGYLGVYDIVFIENDEYGYLGVYDIVFIENDDTEVVVGEVAVGTDLIVEVEIFSEEIEAES